ncbi:MAG: hypothetical protein AB1585_05350 [Thermodesulfobacteriota bacterium]
MGTKKVKKTGLFTFVAVIGAIQGLSAVLGQPIKDEVAGGPLSSSWSWAIGISSVKDKDTPPSNTENNPVPPAIRRKGVGAIPPKPSGLTLRQRLDAWDGATRSKAQLQLELSSRASSLIKDRAYEIETLWNDGRYDAALEKLQKLEAGGTSVALGVSWISPQPAPGTKGQPTVPQVYSWTDVRIGSRAGGYFTKLDFDKNSRKLFAVVRWDQDNGWGLYMSSDRGASWSETYFWYAGASHMAVDVDMTVVGSYVYVGYISTDVPQEARLRRCLVSSGGSDTGYNFQVVFDAGGDSFTEVVLESNADDTNDRIYYAVRESNNYIRWAWDVSSDGTTFTEHSPAGVSAAGGLDMHFNANFSTWDLFFSYIGTDNGVHVLRLRGSLIWEDQIVDIAFTGSHNRTAISAWGNTVICGYEKAYPNGQGISYMINYSAGDSGLWSVGTLAIATNNDFPYYHMVDITARGGQGTAAVFQHFMGHPNDVLFMYRRGYAGGYWNYPIRVNDYDVWTGTWTALNWIPPDDPANDELTYGLIYFQSTIPYFHRFQCLDSPGAITYPTTDNDGSFSVSWLAATTATGYTLERAKDAAFTLGKVTLYNGPLTSYAENGLANGFYYYRVKASNSCGSSPWRTGPFLNVNMALPWLMLLLY